MTPTLTPRERELARHALGLPNRRSLGYGGRVFAFDRSADNAALVEMARRGLARLLKYRTGKSGLQYCYCLTLAGALAALEPGETLDEEDFPR